jgi:putative ABC transport system permease protein
MVFARYAFFDSSMAGDSLFGGKARAVLLSNGFVSDAGRLIPVTVWGVDDKDIPQSVALLNSALAAELPAGTEALALRLPATGLIPSGSLFVTDNYTTSARLRLGGILPEEAGGNLNLRNEQTLPYNLFLNRNELASILSVEGKANLLLCAGRITAAGLAAVWTPALSGISLHRREGFTEMVSDRVFLPEEVLERICANNPTANRLFSYMANEIGLHDRSIPYSFVTALDRYGGQDLAEDEVILSDYTARRLAAGLRDTVRITYYRSDDLKTLLVDTFTGRVARIVPLEELAADRTLSAEFPGLSDVERCTDWESDLPIDMGLIRPEDEDYWTRYRSTPKAILPYRALAGQWGNAYGQATAIRVDSPAVDMSGLEPSMFGLQILYPREAGFEAARGGVDFSTLFLSLGFLIIVSAVLLMLVPLSEMVYARRGELALLREIGYPSGQIVRLLWREAAPVAFFASLAGALAGLLYTRLVLLLLGSLWRGATHTGGFILFSDLRAMLIGLAAGLGIALLLLRRVIRQTVNKPSTDSRISEQSFLRRLPFSRSKLMWAGLYANRKRAGLSFVTLTFGVLLVFTVGLNRRGFTDSAQLLSGTGGYSLWCESSVPVYHNLQTPEGRDKLALKALPDDARVLQMFRYGSDDASCLNLNKVTQPTVLGVDMEALRQSAFRIERSLYPEGASPFDLLQAEGDSVCPALIDETVLTWGLMLNLGDTLTYESSSGRKVCLRLAGTLANSVFQGNILIDRKRFSEIWKDIRGSEVMLVKVSEAETEASRRLLSQALSEYGVRVSTTAERLKAFNSVTDTYLTIFLSLGGLGLLLGMMSFIIVIRKDLAARKGQISLYRSLGFPEERIARLLSAESRKAPLYAILVGVFCSLAGVSGGIEHVSLWVWLLAAGWALLLLLCAVLFIHQSVKQCLSKP